MLCDVPTHFHPYKIFKNSLNVTNKTHDSPKGPNSSEPVRMPAINTVWATSTMFPLSQTRSNCKNHIKRETRTDLITQTL